MKYQRAVIKESVPRSMVDQVAQREQWILQQETSGDEETPFEKTWVTSNRQTAIHYIEDPTTQVHYLYVNGANQEHILAILRSNLALYSLPELQQMIQNAQGTEARIDALYHLATAMPPIFDANFLPYFAAALADPNPDVRSAAIFACAFVTWVELRAPLEQIARHDQDAELRAAAQDMIDALTQHYWHTTPN
ncbi:MAG: HEAT repeat domain-containing protein [Chloroflexota bacterium]|nr:HEAT repeat domain-containing protein [Chloroflexota bacterium]